MARKFDENNAVLVGVIIAPHGVEGAVTVENLSDNPRRFSVGAEFYDESGNTYALDQASDHKGRLLLHFQGIDNRNDAEKLRGKRLHIDICQSETLPDGAYYHYQLLGMEVCEAGVPLGKITDILTNRANDVFLVETPDGREILIPALKTVVKKVDTAGRTMEVQLPEGLK